MNGMNWREMAQEVIKVMVNDSVMPGSQKRQTANDSQSLDLTWTFTWYLAANLTPLCQSASAVSLCSFCKTQDAGRGRDVYLL